MKNFTLTLLSVLFFSFQIFSQNFSGIKIYINPGHGGHDSNDRFIAATGFWESEGNLEKGLHLRDILVAMNANIVMSRVTNFSSDDKPLSQIVAEANASNADYFHSIHSNAFNGQTNYTLILFQGFDNNPTYDSAKIMGSLLADEIWKAHRTTGKFNRGDFDFYGTGQPYLGVFKNLQMPGTLSEGSFHDYIPESWRLKNNIYNKHESWAIVKAFADYFQLSDLPYGEIAGIVRDNSKSVYYFALSSLGDTKQPLNNITVTLKPGNRVYQGDSLNNGFYLFDSLAPGQYTVVFEANGYYKDSTTLNVIADRTVFADKNLIFDTTSAPVVTTHFPSNPNDSIKTVEPVKISFSRPMNRTATEGAFSINPPVQGTFSWEENDQRLVFTPFPPFNSKTTYTVTVSTAAKSIWNVNIPNSHNFSFKTKTRRELTFESSYPDNNQTDLSTTLQIRLRFDASIFNSSLTNRVLLLSSNDDTLNVKNVKIFSENGKGLIYFEPKDPLAKNSDYKVVLKEGITDTEGFPLLGDRIINFKTTDQPAYNALVLNSFENLSGWTVSKFGTGTNAALKITSLKKITGNNGGQLDYLFDQVNDGSIKISNSTTLAAQGSNDFGVWIFGDLSHHVIEYIVTDDSANTISTVVDTIDWTGWKLKLLPVTVPVNAGNTVYYSVILRKTNSNTLLSILYFDDVQFVTGPANVDDDGVISVSDYHLYQNYPNPFNPETSIRFYIPESGYVTLKIYDVLGNEVATLLNEEKSAGTHTVKFAASKNEMSSGVYFYTLKAGNFVTSKKLVLLK